MVLDYALVSNMGGAALVSRDLSVDWLALPRFDSPPLFLRVLDEVKGGYWSIRFGGEVVGVRRGYVSGAPILRSVVELRGGVSVEVVDFMPIGISAFVRMVRAGPGVSYDMVIRPTFNYGLVEPYVEDHGRDALLINPLGNDAVELLLIEGSCEREGTEYRCSGPSTVMLHYPGDRRLSIIANRDFKSVVYNQFRSIYEATLRYWMSTIKEGVNETVDKVEAVYRASITVLLSLIYRTTGGIVSAPTTSLPEIIGEGRNWDYRFVWVRDASLAATALLKAGYPQYARSILAFLVGIADMLGKPFDYSVYTIDGTYPFDEREIPWLRGYMGSKPVRVGNAATTQLQLDLEGWFMDALYEYVLRTEDRQFLELSWPVIETAADWCSSSYTLQDAGLWEQRDRYRHYVHSKVMMWVCLDRASRLARIYGNKDLSDEWNARANKVREYVLSNQPEMFTASFEDRQVDAALLTLPLYGFVDVNDKRFQRTLDQVVKELVVNNWVFRYRQDFLGMAKHPFVLTTEWLGMVYALMGKVDEARAILTNIANCANDLGLLGEHVDITTCEPRGNYPHIFSHSGYIILHNLIAEGKKT